MTEHDLRLSRLLRACAADLEAPGPNARACALDLLDRIDSVSPGLLEQAAARALLRRLYAAQAY
jgi:hypothetical protein